MRGLFIGVHCSCSFFQESFLYPYIISVKYHFFLELKMYYWKYLLSSKQNGKEAKLVAFDELSQWLRFHNIKKKKKKKNVPGCPSWWFYHVIKEESKRTFQIIFLIGILLPYMVISILMLKLLDYLSLIMSSIMRLLATHINKTSVCTSLLWYFWS